MQVHEILRIKGTVLYTVVPSQSLDNAVATMADLDVGSLVVMEHGLMAGLLSFREVLRALRTAGGGWQTLTVADVMQRDPATAHPDMEVDELRRLMLERHCRYLPIMEGDTLMGVLSFHDVARAMLEEQSFENRMLKSYIRDWPMDDASG
ncbi:CBS domain-containing protein [Methyloversatilis sp.]|uniref:CBS domain-containing protein n=1 Tax=Methyloversatilis sp. TaxID=2569862 RepID=UPI0027371BD2|nr:CBS domain-containing protein [Methyloversatilis sp.]MDP2870517.1 CBS domain-containing protein [Methyloversatilis sp.]MDP3288593.1 CBS domain-containing protein [Methyloversatilis sp.]MDP3457621.1 CBS domain-containing protein [Methyloversatilis sp.]MDP3577846.1 CBS domain-containing protein [Methyloversatilis sp.]